MKQFHTKDNTIITRQSRWLRIRDKQVTKRHALYDYADHNSDDGKHRTLWYFTHKGRMYALNQFHQTAYPIFFEDEDGKLNYLSAYDSTQYYKPYLLEISECCEACRLYTESKVV